MAAAPRVLAIALVGLRAVASVEAVGFGAAGAGQSAEKGGGGGLLRASPAPLRNALVPPVEPKHSLRVCNAYTSWDALRIYRNEEMITPPSLAYRQCGELWLPIVAGDELRFQIGPSEGSISVPEMPSTDSVLQLVLYKHQTFRDTIAFESHVFTKLVNAQAVVLDVYSGQAEAEARIQDLNNASSARSEELEFGTVVELSAGMYEVVLQGKDGTLQAREPLVVLSKESYAVVRVGAEASPDGLGWPQELIVFPHSDARALLGSSAAPPRRSWRTAGVAIAGAAPWLLAAAALTAPAAALP